MRRTIKPQTEKKRKRTRTNVEPQSAKPKSAQKGKKRTPKRSTKGKPKQRAKIHPTTIPFPPGQKKKLMNADYFWEIGPKGGKPRKFTSPDHLWAVAVEYFKWVEDNPLQAEHVVGQYMGEVVETVVNKKRPMTIGGLCLFAGISVDTWNNRYRHREEYVIVCQIVEHTIREQKFSGAAAGFFNHAIIARDLGLVDKKDIVARNITKTISDDMDVKEAEQAYKDFLKGQSE